MSNCPKQDKSTAVIELVNQCKDNVMFKLPTFTINVYNDLVSVIRYVRRCEGDWNTGCTMVYKCQREDPAIITIILIRYLRLHNECPQNNIIPSIVREPIAEKLNLYKEIRSRLRENDIIVTLLLT